MKQKLIMTKGLPASGKSTWAKEQVDQFGFKRINKDDLRAMIDNSKHSKENENMIVAIENAMIKEFLSKNYSVIVDNTHFHPPHEERLRLIAESFRVKFEIKDFTDVSLEECILRDQKRPNYVGEKVIRSMYNQYLNPNNKQITYNHTLPNCIIVDIDGTIANNRGIRGPFEFDKVYDDNPKHEVLEVIDAFCAKKDLCLFIFSGREATKKCLQETERWLLEKVLIQYPNFKNAFYRSSLNSPVLRLEKDYRNDSIIKKEMYDTHIKDKFNVLAVFDDRNQVVDMWRSLGLQVFQVAEGDF